MKTFAVLVLLVWVTACSSSSSSPSSSPSSSSSSSSSLSSLAAADPVATVAPSTTAPTKQAPTTASLTTTPSVAPTSLPTSFDVVVFSRTTAFRHDSIPAGTAALTELGVEHGFTVTATEEVAIFTDEALAEFEVIVFLSTTGDVLDVAQQAAMERFVQAGGGYVGVHSAADTEYDWPWYGGLVGAWFDGHPAPQPARLMRVGDHPITVGMPDERTFQEEWYNFRAQPDPSVTILATIDETTYTGGTMGVPHPVAWAHEYDGGRGAYLVFGHDAATFADPMIRTLLAQSIVWAAG